APPLGGTSCWGPPREEKNCLQQSRTAGFVRVQVRGNGFCGGESLKSSSARLLLQQALVDNHCESADGADRGAAHPVHEPLVEAEPSGMETLECEQSEGGQAADPEGEAREID